MTPRPLWLLLLTPLFVGCIHIFPRDVEPTIPDRGKELSQSPYDFRNAPEYSKGRVDGFKELYVEADPFADAMAPVAPLPPAKVKAPAEKASLPEGFAPVALIRPDLSKLTEGRTFEDLARAAGAGRGVTLAMPTEALIALKAPEDRRSQGRFVQDVLGTKFGPWTVKEVATVEIVDALPEPMLTGDVLLDPNDPTLVMVAPTPPPPPPPPEKGTLPLDNITTSYAFITVNGKKLGVLPPLAKARIRDVKSGVYEVGWEVPNGFTWTERLATRTDLGPKVKVEGDRILLLEKVYFDSGRDSVQARSRRLMDEIAEILLDHPEITKVRVEGHTDSDGNDAFNLDLSRRRAATVVRMLVTRGVDPERVVPEGFGESRPIAPNTDAAGKASNRRVELHIVGRDSSGTADDESAE